MRVYKARADLIPADVYHFVSFLFDIFSYFNYAVVLDKDIAGIRSSAGTIIYQTAFEQCLHLCTSLFPYGINKCLKIVISPEHRRRVKRISLFHRPSDYLVHILIPDHIKFFGDIHLTVHVFYP